MRRTLLCELASDELAHIDDAVLRTLAGARARISLAMRDFSENRADFVRRATAAGVPVVAWIVVDERDGYWCHARNVEAVRARVQAFEQWLATHRLEVAGVAFDVEPAIDDTALMPTAGWRMLPRLARTVIDRDELATAEAAYAEIAREQAGRGREVFAYVVAMASPKRGTSRVRRTLGVPHIDGARPIPMLYSSFLRPFGAGLVRAGSRNFQQIAIGSTGGGVTAGGLDRVRPLSPSELRRDLSDASLAEDVHLFSLEGCLATGLLDEVLAAPMRGSESRATAWGLVLRVLHRFW